MTNTENLDLGAISIDTVLNENWQKIDENVINKNGTVAFIAEQIGVDPTNEQGLATKNYVDNKAVNNVWISGECTMVAGSLVTVNHNLNLTDLSHVRADVLYKCVAAEGGYSVGDYLMNPIGLWTYGDAWASTTPLVSTNAIQTCTPDGLIWGSVKGGTSRLRITLANWRVIFRIWY